MKRALIILFIALILASLVSSLTASIANSKMVLYPEAGETVEKSIGVINSNNQTVIVNISVSGDLKDNTKLRDTSFTLQPNETRKAYFTIYSDEDGTFETNINIGFMPTEGKNGVGISSTVILVVGGKTDAELNPGREIGTIDNSTNVSTGLITGGAIFDSGKLIPGVFIGMIILLFVLIIVLLIVVIRRNKFKRRSEAK